MGHAPRVGNRDIALDVIAGVLRNSLADPRMRNVLLKTLWIEAKRFSARNIVSIELSRIRGMEGVKVDGPVSRHCPLVLSALAILLECQTVFEFGTYRGDTAWLLAHNLPSARIYTLDLPGPTALETAALELTDPEYFTTWDRGSRFRGMPEADRIVPLFGDAATFDFSPYSGKIDLVYIDASHSYSYVRSDTEAAFGMLSETGTIVWDDYTHYPGIYAYLNEIAPSLDAPVYHLLGTRLALYSRWDIVTPPSDALSPQRLELEVDERLASRRRRDATREDDERGRSADDEQHVLRREERRAAALTGHRPQHHARRREAVRSEQDPTDEHEELREQPAAHEQR